MGVVGDGWLDEVEKDCILVVDFIWEDKVLVVGIEDLFVIEINF